MNINILLMFIILFFTIDLHSQPDTTRLDEVVLNKNVKLKTKKIKLRSDLNFAEPLTGISQIVTLVENVPAGKLNEISFFTGRTHYIMANRETRTELSNLPTKQFELLVYDVAEDGTPGKQLNGEPIFFSVNGKDTGKITIDLTLANIKTGARFFVGFKCTTPPKDNGFEFDALLFDGMHKYISYYKSVTDAFWKLHFNKDGYGLKLNANIVYVKN